MGETGVGMRSQIFVWTKDDRLRAPVFLGMRTEVAPEEVVRETGFLAEEADQESKQESFLSADKAETTLDVDGHRLKFTIPQQDFYPADGYTKRDVINFYAAVADLLVPHLQGRPLSLKRYPQWHRSGFLLPERLLRDFLTGCTGKSLPMMKNPRRA